MALNLPRWPVLLDLAEALRRRAEEAGPPPPVTGLAPRPRTAFDRLVDALNRLPRPIATLGTLALLGTALAAPDWFADRMEALSRMPEGLWWLIGAVLSLHFGARAQARSHEFRREMAASEPLAPATPASPGADAALILATLAPGPNPALAEWKAAQP